MQLITGKHMFWFLCRVLFNVFSGSFATEFIPEKKRHFIMLLCKLAVVYEVQVLIYVVIKYSQA